MCMSCAVQPKDSILLFLAWLSEDDVWCECLLEYLVVLYTISFFLYLVQAYPSCSAVLSKQLAYELGECFNIQISLFFLILRIPRGFRG